MRVQTLTVLVFTVIAGLPFLWMAAEVPPQPSRWFKGNLHAHTVNSDGDSTPADVVSWYRERNYNFLVLSDHNYLTEIGGLNQVYAAKDKFLLIPGEEVSSSLKEKEVHVNGYGLADQVPRQTGNSIVDLLQKSVDAIRGAKGIPSVNHPNYTWAIGSKELLAIKNLRLFEVFNNSWSVGNRGGGGYESNEEMWDAVLSAGYLLYGIAVDDAHDFKSYGRALPYPPTVPGTGWIQVRASELTVGSVLKALNEGDFYASTGVVLDDIQSTSAELTVQIHRTRDNLYRTYFIGQGGKVLATSTQLKPVYRFAGDEAYVRARIEESNGGNAWTQPIMRTARAR
ncbi:MAG: CehA/McbA family metallohydrolase [Bryobacteraceae bacterium]|nr:CehA/McbA family metallohydrolase [Bryobacteraceae bacterium]